METVSLTRIWGWARRFGFGRKFAVALAVGPDITYVKVCENLDVAPDD